LTTISQGDNHHPILRCHQGILTRNLHVNATYGSPPARTLREGYRRKTSTYTSSAQRYPLPRGIMPSLGPKPLQGKMPGDKARLQSATILENVPPNTPLSPKPLRNRYKVLPSPSRKAPDKGFPGSNSLASTRHGTSPYQSNEYTLATKPRLQPTNLPESPSPTHALPSPRLFRSFQPTSASIPARDRGHYILGDL
jgi:hypothetical protein